MPAKRYFVPESKPRSRSPGLDFVPPESAPASFTRSNSKKTIGFAQEILTDGLRAMVENFGGVVAFADRIEADHSLVSKYLTNEAAFPERRVDYWVQCLGLSGDDAETLRDAFALANASSRVLDLIPGWETTVKAIGLRLGKIQPG